MERCSVKTMDKVMECVLAPSVPGFFVEKSFHEGWCCNKWCVWYSERLFLCACDTKREAVKIADALNVL